MTTTEAIINNLFWGYDTVIVILAILNAVVLGMAFKARGKLNILLLYSLNDKSVNIKKSTLSPDASADEVKNIKEARSKANLWHSIFANCIAIFPLLGLLGTVVALISLSGGEGIEDTQNSFMVSLTSTFWGMIFAIIYKIFDAIFSPKLELLNADTERAITIRDEKVVSE